MSICVLGAVLGADALVEPGSAQAEVRAGVRGGVLAAASSLSLPEGDLGVQGGSSYALDAGWDLSTGLAIEARWQQVFSALDVDDAAVTATMLDVSALTAGLRYTLLGPGERIRPWLSGHLGWYRAAGEVTQRLSGAGYSDGSTSRSSVRRSGDTIGFNVGAGVDLRVTDRVSVDLEVRYHYTSELDFLTPLAGVTFRFGP